MNDTRQFDVRLQTRLGELRTQLPCPKEPMRLADLVPIALSLTDAFVSQGTKQHLEAGRSVSCSAGCGACCRQLVMVSVPEAFHLARYLNTLPKARRTAVRRRFDAAVASLEKENLTEELMNPKLSKTRNGFPVVETYFNLGIPCPLLEDESCSIYPERPAPCRDYNVLSDPLLCANPYNSDIDKVPMPVPLTMPLAKLTALLRKTEIQLVPLVLAWDLAEANAAFDEQTWPSAELLGAFLKLTADELSKQAVALRED